MRSLIFVCFGTLALNSCQTVESNGHCVKPTGLFVNTTVLSKCPESMPSDVPHFCLEMTFSGNDSVSLDNGFEKFSLPFKQEGNGCTFKILAASLFGDMYFVVDSDSSVLLVDTAWTKENTSTRFLKEAEPNERAEGFEEQLNNCLFTGQYTLYKDGQPQPGLVDILSNGQMNGFKPYIGYAICYAGDCLEETSPPANTIELIDNRGVRETFVFKNNSGTSTIELYSVGPRIPDIKGERTIGPKVFELRPQ